MLRVRAHQVGYAAVECALLFEQVGGCLGARAHVLQIARAMNHVCGGCGTGRGGKEKGEEEGRGREKQDPQGSFDRPGRPDGIRINILLPCFDILKRSRTSNFISAFAAGLAVVTHLVPVQHDCLRRPHLPHSLLSTVHIWKPGSPFYELHLAAMRDQGPFF